MANKFAKYEQDIGISNTLKHMHLPGGKPGDLDDPKNVLYSVHQRGKHRSLWYISNWETLEAQNNPTNKELVTYKSKIFPYTHLHRTLLTTITPYIRATNGFQIRFCDNLFINMIKEFNLELNDVNLQYGNNHFLHCHMKTSENWDKYKKEIGNNPNLTNWSEELPATPIALYLPWFYARDKSDSFPLLYCGQHDRLNHIIEFRLKLSELLIMRNHNNEIVDFNPDYIEVSDNRESIHIPEMEGLYTIPTQAECENTNCTIDETTDGKELFTESIYFIEDENEKDLGKKIPLKIDSRKRQPVSQIYWGAKNINLSEMNKNCSFYYNSNNSKISPVKFTKLETIHGTIFDNKSSYKTELAYHLQDSRYKTDTPGINRYSNSILLKEDYKKFPVGLVLASGAITITLNDKAGQDIKDKFLTFAVLQHTRRFKFKQYPKTQEERLTMGCTIEEDDDE